MILFVGDSITHGTNWSDVVDFEEVLNIAVPGFSTDDVNNQLKELVQYNPKVISLLIGTNDFGNPEINRTGQDVGMRVLGIVNAIVSELKTTKVVVNSILPRGAIFTDRIKVANKIISSYQHSHIKYLDCWGALSSEGHLRDEYLLQDGFDVHLNQEGYEAWQSLLIPELRKYS